MTEAMLDFNGLGNLLLVYGMHAAGALVVAVVGWWAASLVERGVRRALMASPHMDLTVAAFLASLARYGVLVVAFVAILQIIGIQATSLVAVIGAASLAVGLALQGTLSNMAAGVMLLLFRPFRLGDSIEVGGVTGTVKNLNLFMTEVASGDNVQVLIPNGKVWGNAITNFSAYSTRRLSLSVPVSLDRNVEKIVAGLRDLLAQDARVLKEPPPSVVTSSLAEKTVEISVQAWAQPDQVGALRTDIVQRLHGMIQAPEPGARPPT
jgi:small conductance mechanosensitive channel